MPRIIPGLQEKILATAQKFFWEQGFSQVEMKALAREIGTSVGNLYNYYPSKESLFLACTDAWWNQWKASLPRILESSADPLDKLLQFLESLKNLMEKKRGLWQDVVAVIQAQGTWRQASLQYREEAREIFFQTTDGLLAQLEDRSPTLKTLRALDPRKTAFFLLAPMLQGPILASAGAPDPMEFLRTYLAVAFGLKREEP